MVTTIWCMFDSPWQMVPFSCGHVGEGGVGARDRCRLSNWRFNPETVNFLGPAFGRTDFSRIFIFEPPDFFADFLAGFFLLIFVGKSAQKNPPGKSPGKSSKIYTTKILQHISADCPGQIFFSRAQNSLVDRLLTSTMSSQSYVQVLQNGSILACVSWGLAFPQRSANKGLPLPLGRGVCETKSKNGRSRPRKPFISRVFLCSEGVWDHRYRPYPGRA